MDQNDAPKGSTRVADPLYEKTGNIGIDNYHFAVYVTTCDFIHALLEATYPAGLRALNN